MLTIKSPAKLNLTLEVLAKRQDGFHEIRSIIQTINLFDTLHFKMNRTMGFNSDESSWFPEESLVSKAAKLLQEAAWFSKGATIRLDKRIPLLSGLGGDSSDATATLRGLNELWGLNFSPDKLLELAAKLGSDIAFFLCGGTALVEGRGEIVTPLPPASHMWVVLLLPPVPRKLGKTKRLYSNVQARHYTSGQITGRLVDWLIGGREVMPSMLFNVFDSVAWESYSGLRKYWEQFLAVGAREVHLAGSGPTLYTIIEDMVQAEKIYQRLQEQGLAAYLAETISGVELVTGQT
jgi:4-diphosphocytidyl-2-C-methyl-D-erythritol kinase